MGIQPVDKVAYVGDAYCAGWARLARVRIVAEIPEREAINFWGADPSVRSQAIKILAGTGAKAIVTEKIPKNSASTVGWQRIGNTEYHAFRLKE